MGRRQGLSARSRAGSAHQKAGSQNSAKAAARQAAEDAKTSRYAPLGTRIE